MAKSVIVAIPYRRVGLNYSKVRPDMSDLPLAEAEGVLVHEYSDDRHTFRIGVFA